MTFRFKKFKVYQDAKTYCKLGREVIEKYIRKKDRELASQIGKALHSIVLNIAEGSGDNSDMSLPDSWGFPFVRFAKWLPDSTSPFFME